MVQEKLLEILEAMVTNQEILEANDVALAKTTAEELDMRIVIIGVVSVLIAIVVAFFVTRMIVVPVARAANGLKMIAEGKLGQRVASDMVTLGDVGESVMDELAAGTLYVDDEGVRTEDTLIIEDGILKSYLHDRTIPGKFPVSALKDQDCSNSLLIQVVGEANTGLLGLDLL